jgi:hypothetical protein
MSAPEVELFAGDWANEAQHSRHDVVEPWGDDWIY